MDNQQKEKGKHNIGVSSLDGKKLESLQAESLVDPDEYEIPDVDENISLEALLAELEEEDKKVKAEYEATSTKKCSQPTMQREPQAKTVTGSLPHPELIMARAELKKVESEKLELQELFQRRQADFDNFRKRVARDRSDSLNRLTGDVIRKLLPVIDNLQRALEAHKAIDIPENSEYQHFVQGIELIFVQLNEVLGSLGVKPIPTVGEQFDPHIHEAVAIETSEEYAPDVVIEELQRGYCLGDILIRPAMVKVAAKV